MENKYQKLAEVIEEAVKSPFTRELALRAYREENYNALAALLVNLVQAGDLWVITWDEIEELTPEYLLAHVNQHDTASAYPWGRTD